MSALNVSRFRMASFEAMPKTAQIATLAPVLINSQYIYAAFDSLGDP